MKKEYIANIIVIIFGIIVLLGIGYIIKKDIKKLEDHLTKCKKECYPAQVAEDFSRKYCMCQPIIEEKSVLDTE